MIPCTVMTDLEAMREFLLVIILIAIAIVVVDIVATLWGS